jgi:hypothetical protein
VAAAGSWTAAAARAGWETVAWTRSEFLEIIPSRSQILTRGRPFLGHLAIVPVRALPPLERVERGHIFVGESEWSKLRKLP